MLMWGGNEIHNRCWARRSRLFSPAASGGYTFLLAPATQEGGNDHAVVSPIGASLCCAARPVDAKANVWMISYLGIPAALVPVDVLASRSIDGGLTWGNPVVITADRQFNDKNWSVCDNTVSSPHYGNCYTEFDDASLSDLEQMS